MREREGPMGTETMHAVAQLSRELVNRPMVAAPVLEPAIPLIGGIDALSAVAGRDYLGTGRLPALCVIDREPAPQPDFRRMGLGSSRIRFTPRLDD